MALVCAALPADRGRAEGAPFALTAQRDPDGTLRLAWRMAPGIHLYRDRISAATETGQAVPVATPPGHMEDDPNFGPTEIYRTHATATIAPGALAGVSRLVVRYQGCAERGICYPPARRTVDLATLAVQMPAATPAVAAAGWDPAPSAETVPLLPALTGLLPVLVVTFFGLGLLLAFTPCVLPMVPILAGMLAGSGPDQSPMRGRGFVLSATYALAMATAYAALGVAASWSGLNLQMALQTPVALSAMAAVFVVLGLASFGLFDLRLPAALTARFAGRPGGALGPVSGAAILGFTSALIVGPCVTPPLAAALLYVAQTGDIGRGAAALFALGLGMGLPLVLVGTFGTRLLPRSGPWLRVTNRIFGFVFLGLAVSLVGRAVPAPAALALWAALAIGGGVFAGAFDRLSPTDGAVRRLGKATGILAVVYGATLAVGAAAGQDDPLRPLAFTAGAQAPEAETVVHSTAELDAALAGNRGSGRPVLIAFSAAWCTACRTIERTVLADPAVREKLRGVTVIRADITAPGPPSEGLMRRFQVAGPPTLIFLDDRGSAEIAGTRSTGEVSAAEFRRVLDRLGA
ncbi:protein-disulfide reductase DsbD [Methylobacterium mesophilicum]|uniref:protein-disulfide reductase DsbD n=1 Tax=Methylobacterium mesophilicum TaxID=39956 RepID=UPI002F35B148